jgi:hypothetical protein
LPAKVPVKSNIATHVEWSREVPVCLLYYALLSSRFDQPNNVLTHIEFALTGKLGNAAVLNDPMANNDEKRTRLSCWAIVAPTSSI